MEIVERYLKAIEFWLPKQQRRDIIAELAEDLHSQIEEQENQLGRSLNAAELEAIVKQRGMPILVANRYLPQRYLIGPVFFPVYVFVLKICAFCYLLPACAIFIITRHALNPTTTWVSAFAAGLSGLWTGAFICAGIITIVFAVLQRKEAQLVGKWNPRQLPPVRNPNKIPRSSSVAELIVNLTIIIWWISSAWSPHLLNVRLSFNAFWAVFFWGFLFTTVLNAALAVANLMRPYWTTWRAVFRMTIDCVGGVLFCWLLKADVIAVLAIAGVEPGRAEQFRTAINFWLERTFPYALLVVFVMAGANLYRVIRVSRISGNQRREALSSLA